jgi:3-dehydroquinate dehydratase type I|uniref:3-dehydroquinate dehydratase n=1 Tax=Desulfobacca acetoxidans TaxID=60893 RepID=A0A7V6DNZ2_9BACT
MNTANSKQQTANPLRLCVPIVAANPARARSHYIRAARKGLWAEIRLDYLEKPDLRRLFRTFPGPVIATNRHPEEGGRWRGTEDDRCLLLEEARELGVPYLDLEFRSDPQWRETMWALKPSATELILSWHDLTGTPDSFFLEDTLDIMLEDRWSHIIKMVTYATKPDDNLRLLSLIPKARAAGKEIIAFCMGPLGKWSRVATVFLGGFLTFTPFNPQQASAPGQITVAEFRRMWRILRK